MNDPTIDVHSCSNPDCRVSETGKCVEGFTVISECPHQQNNEKILTTIDPKEEFEEIPGPIEPEYIKLAKGTILSEKAVTQILRSSKTHVLSVVGPFKSGKTTFSLSLYEAFQNGPFDCWSFSGSQTLFSFEEKCHLSRIECGGTQADTERTKLGDGLKFWHLELTKGNEQKFNLLISDRSGELYTLSANSAEASQDLYEVLRADYVLFLVDGKKLSSDDDRHGVKSDIIMLIASLLDSGMLTDSHRIGIALTKYDYVLSRDHNQRVLSDFDDLLEKIRNRFGTNVKEIRRHIIASRPENDEVEPLYGLTDVIKCVTAPKEVKSAILNSELSSDRVFINFGVHNGEAINESK